MNDIASNESIALNIEIETIDYASEKESRQKRLLAYSQAIQNEVLESSSQIIKELVEERHRQNITQQQLADMTGIHSSNIARFESGTRVPTLVGLQKYAAALGKHIELNICDIQTK